MLTLAIQATLVVAAQPLSLARIGDGPARLVFPAMAVAGITGICLLMLLDRFPERLKSWRIMRMAAAVAEDTRRLFLAPRYGVTAIALGVVGFSLISLIAYLLARGF